MKHSMIRNSTTAMAAAIAVVLFLIMLCFIVAFLWKMYQDEKDWR